MSGCQFDIEPLNTNFDHGSSDSFPSMSDPSVQSITFQVVSKDVLGDAIKHLAKIKVASSTVLLSSTKQVISSQKAITRYMAFLGHLLVLPLPGNTFHEGLIHSFPRE